MERPNAYSVLWEEVEWQSSENMKITGVALKILSLGHLGKRAGHRAVLIKNKTKELFSEINTTFLFQIYQSPKLSLVMLKRYPKQLMILYMSASQSPKIYLVQVTQMTFLFQRRKL